MIFTVKTALCVTSDPTATNHHIIPAYARPCVQLSDLEQLVFDVCVCVTDVKCVREPPLLSVNPALRRKDRSLYRSLAIHSH